MLFRIVLLFMALNTVFGQGFTVDTKSFKIEWEAYKFASRAAVKGTFDRYMAGGFHQSQNHRRFV